MEQHLKAILEQARHDHLFTGAVVAFVSSGNQKIIPVGYYDETESDPISDMSMFDVASITKSIPVATLALYLIDQGEVTLDTPIRSLIPRLKTTYAEDITLWHLLTQTLDYHFSLAALKHLSADEILQSILTAKFTIPPGEKMSYSNATSILLGMVIETITGQKLDLFADELFFKPMGMLNTTFHPGQFPQNNIVPTEHDPWRARIVRGEVHDESTFVLRNIMVPGSAGLFSTAPDLLIFLTMLLNKGTYRNKQYFSEGIIEQMVTNQLKGVDYPVGLGWELNQSQYMGHYTSDATIGKTGFTGCVVIADLTKGRAMVLLTNYHYPQRKASSTALHALRGAIADVIFAA